MKVRIILATLAAAACVAAQQAHAEDPNGVVFAGGAVNEGQSAYAGAVVALPGARLGSGFAVRGTVTGGRYDYDSGDQNIKATYVGGDLALVYQTSGKWGWASFSAGPRVTDTNFKPQDPGNRRQGTRVDAGLQSDGAFDGRRWRASWLVSYAVNDEAYQAQFRLAHKLGDDRYRLGVEGGILGDPSFNQKSAGLHAALPFMAKSELQVGAGFVFQDGNNSPYGSLGFSHIF